MPSALLKVLYWQLALIAAPSLCSALTFDLDPWGTDKPVPDTIVFFYANLSSGDPQFVDVILVNTKRENTTTLFANHDLNKLPDAGFRLPYVPTDTGFLVRMTDTTSTPPKTLAESKPFQIYPPGTPPSPSQTETGPMSGTVLPTTSSVPTSTRDETSADKKSSVPVGAIAGGVVGGVALIALFGFLLYCIRRQGRPITAKELEKKQKKKLKLKENDVVSPFIVDQPPPPIPLSGTSPTESTGSHSAPASRSYEPRSEKARLAQTLALQAQFTPPSVDRFPTELTASSTLAGGSSQHHTPSSLGSETLATTTPTHRRKQSKRRKAPGSIPSSPVEELKRERDRLDREISELERRSSMGGSRTPRRHDTESDEMLAQLTALRERMHMIDSQASPRASNPEEPPPDYTSIHPRR
ncbi:hypothetical protein D9611_001527 [Ephemerocybe angulata]|uniref:Uncharacterized protein n=1 Tax=Ephemerocybe angulata TaxID=980116 RepID=A0A8H5FN06_9AGAR|nr:hypothetical protein D9611_001527 [Tulosesus angulatus]